MEPEIRYVRSADGTIIAVTTLGQGPPLVSVTSIANFASTAGDLATPYRRPFYEGLARDWTFVSYDPRGIGLSQRDVDDVSLEAHVADLAAVVDSLGPGPFPFRVGGTSAAVGVRYAVQHPDRVSKLILIGPAPNNAARRLDGARRVIAPIFDYDFDLWVRVLLLMDAGWEDGAVIYNAVGSSAVSKDMLLRQWRETRRWDMTDDLPRLQCPTLVLHTNAPDSAGPDGLDNARRVTAAIPNARFASFDWNFRTNPLLQLEAHRGFLLEDGASPVTAASPPPASMAVILFADIADSTALTERLGDGAFRERAHALDDALRIAVRDNGGAVIDAKTLGDGILATFPAASQAIASALACAAAGDGCALPLHVGLHAGDVIREKDNVFGGAVNIAARISALAAPGEVLVSDIVRGLARTSAGVTFDDRGDHALKGVADPQRVFAIRPS